MTDRRQLASNGRVAAAGLQGLVAADHFVEGFRQQIGQPVVDLTDAPDGRRDRQLVYGEVFHVLEIREGFAFGTALRDGYAGYVPAGVLMNPIEATHMVAAPASHAYAQPDMKTHERFGLSFGSRFRVVSASGAFFETDEGLFIPKPHVRPLNKPFHDPATAAQLFFGVPYLWGGNSVWGIDCSGLVQAAFLAAGYACPGDSDQQAAQLGTALDAGEPIHRGDLLFWKGHVAIAVDDTTLIHANAHDMAVAYEPIDHAIKRIEDSGDGPVTGHRRVEPRD